MKRTKARERKLLIAAGMALLDEMREPRPTKRPPAQARELRPIEMPRKVAA